MGGIKARGTQMGKGRVEESGANAPVVVFEKNAGAGEEMVFHACKRADGRCRDDAGTVADNECRHILASENRVQVVL